MKIISIFVRCCIVFGVAVAMPSMASDRSDPAITGADVTNRAFLEYYGGHGHAMVPESWQSAWSAFQGEVNCRNTGASGPRRLFYPLHVPVDQQLNWIDLWGFDSSSSDLAIRVLKVCQDFLTPGLPVVTQLATGGSTGTPGRFHRQILVDDEGATPSTCKYVVEARFTAEGIACAGPDLGLLRVRAEFSNPDLIYRDGFFRYREFTTVSQTSDPGDGQ